MYSMYLNGWIITLIYIILIKYVVGNVARRFLLNMMVVVGGWVGGLGGRDNAYAYHLCAHPDLLS